MNQEFHALIQEARSKFGTEHNLTSKRNHLNESYQEYQILNAKNSFDQLILNLERLALTDNPNQKYFLNVLQSPKKYASSLLSFCLNIMQLLRENSKITISHQHHSSQAVFMALFLKLTNPQKQVSILTNKMNFKNWCKYLINPKNTDQESDLQSLLEQVEVKLHFIEESYKQTTINNCQILIIDLMNSEVVVYKPLLFFLKGKLGIPEKTIVYHSHVEEIDVENILKQTQIEFFPVEASITYPIEIDFSGNDAQIKQKLIDFLKEDKNHPQKQDIIIFFKNQHLSNSTATRYAQKLKQVLLQNNLESHIQMVLSKDEVMLQGKNHIFIVENVYQLLEWNYSYDDVLIVVDYGWNVSYRMDHQNNTFIEGLDKCDLKEKTRRLSFIGTNKIGKYLYTQDELSEVKNYLDDTREIMSYTLKMIDLGLCEHLEVQNKRVKQCIWGLLKNQIIQKDQKGKFVISNHEMLEFCQKGIDPIQAKIVKTCIEKQKQKQSKILSNLILMTLCIVNTRGNLRVSKESKGSKLTSKPTGIWRKTGYLDSCIQILTKAEIIQSGKNTKKSISKRKTSKADEQQIFFEGLFEVYAPKKIQFEDMRMDDLLREYFVNDVIFAEMREKLDDLREIFGVQQTNICFDEGLLHEISQLLATFIPKSVVVFSGSRRLGYLYKEETQIKETIFLNRQSLSSQLNETPQFLMILRYSEVEGKKQILLCNSIDHDTFMTVFGELPVIKGDSLAEHEIEFHGVSSSVFKGLFRNNSMQMKKFQDQNQCFIETNEELATITIYCPKEKGLQVKEAFEELFSKIKQKFINYNKIIHYMASTNITISNGGQVKEIIKDNYINKCYLNNLDLSVTQQDLEELFDEFFVLKNIDVLPAEFGKYSKSAIIEFNSQKDYYRFSSYYNECKYFDRLLEVRPIVMKKTDTVECQKYIDFKWYVWQSHRKAIVVFKHAESAQKAYKNLQQNSMIDGGPVKFAQEKKKQNFFQNLDKSVDEIFLEKLFSVHGEIDEVQILKTPLKQPLGQENTLDYILRNALNIPKNAAVDDQFKINSIQRHKSGLRHCKVVVNNYENLNKLIERLNGIKGKIGEGRLYAKSMFTKPILVSYPSALHLYEELLQETINGAQNKPEIRYTIKQHDNHQTYIVLSSPMQNTLNYIAAEFQKKLIPKNIALSSLQKNIILSDVGIDNLIDLQEKFNCKLVVNSLNKTLGVICKIEYFKKIEDEVNLRVEDKFFYRIKLNTRSYKNLSKDKQKLEEIKKKYFLTLLEIEDYSKTLIFEGSANHVQNALNYMMHVIESFSKSEDELINTEVCLICYEEPSRPHRLQNCGHKFCYGCLQQCINSTLGDISMFPIKCPHCMIEVTIDDLERLLVANSWPKLINMAVSQFVGRNSGIMTFCYTAGCKQINMLKLSSFKCDVCAASYCCECKLAVHEGMTCQQARLGTDVLFKKYMQENGVRVCPNSSCKMPIVRTDGCFRVTCSRCNKSMCFKCPADKMIAYDNYNDCYKHLNDAHGGYW